MVHLVSYNEYGYKVPGVYQLVIPIELVEETINELLPLLSSGDIIIDHGNTTLKILRGVQKGWKNLVSNILTVVLLVEFMVWRRGYCLMVGGTSGAVSVCAPFSELAPGLSAAPSTDPMSNVTSAEYGWLHCGGPGGTLCQNGSQWCRIWNHTVFYAEAL